MNQTEKISTEKRAAFKRFSQMGAAGLAVLSLSAFTDLSAKQLPANVENNVVKEQNAQLAAHLFNKSFAMDENLSNYSEIVRELPYNYTNNHSEYGDYCDSYYNHIDYSNYSNNYSNTYTNNYSNNYSDLT